MPATSRTRQERGTPHGVSLSTRLDALALVLAILALAWAVTL